MARSSDVLPQPDGPISETKSPAAMVRSIPGARSRVGRRFRTRARRRARQPRLAFVLLPCLSAAKGAQPPPFSLVRPWLSFPGSAPACIGRILLGQILLQEKPRREASNLCANKRVFAQLMREALSALPHLGFGSWFWSTELAPKRSPISADRRRHHMPKFLAQPQFSAWGESEEIVLGRLIRDAGTASAGCLMRSRQTNAPPASETQAIHKTESDMLRCRVIGIGGPSPCLWKGR
jgi:hypothetical protein